MRLLLTALMGLIMAACSSGEGTGGAALPAGDTITERSQLLTLVRRPGWTEATVADPWHPGAAMARYALADSGADADIPDGFTRVKVPLRRSIVYSSVHTAAIEELGATAAIAGVADGGYLPDTDSVKALLAAGKVRDIGSSMAPMVETVIDIAPDAVLLSPYENASRGGIEKSGATLIEMADYMETSPLARAEWMLLLGELYGRPARARDIYDDVCTAYRATAAKAAGRKDRPKVLTEILTSGVWYVPAGQSYMARLLDDAGADYPWADTEGSGSLQLDEAAVIDRAADADLWLIKAYADTDARRIAADVPHARAFRAFPAGVRVCDTRHTSYFNDIAFHPERVLADMAALFGGAPADSLRYFSPLQ